MHKSTLPFPFITVICSDKTPGPASESAVICVEAQHTKKDICTLLVQQCGSFIAYRNEARAGGWKRQMGNNRKDMSDQRGEGKKHCQRNWDEILKETRRERAMKQQLQNCLLESAFLISREKTGELD